MKIYRSEMFSYAAVRPKSWAQFSCLGIVAAAAVGLLSAPTYGAELASMKLTYTWFLNRPGNALTNFKNLRDVDVDKDFTSAYLTPAVQPLAPPLNYVWTRPEDAADASKKSLDYTVLFRPRGTLTQIPDVIDSPNRVQFSYWQYIRRFVFFGGSAQEGTILAPDPQWINQAHSNSVPIYGTVFLADPAHGGQAADCTTLATDASIIKLVKIAKKLKFDGWFINAESAQGSERAHCEYAIDQVLSAKEVQDSGVGFIKYTPGSGNQRSSWIDDDDIVNVAGIYPVEPHNNGGHVYMNNWSVHNTDLLRPYLMFVDEPYWANLDDSKYLIKASEAGYAKAASDKFWYGDNGLQRHSTLASNGWDGMARLAKGVWGELPDPDASKTPTGFKDRDFKGSNSAIVSGAVRHDTSSVSMDDRTWLQACVYGAVPPSAGCSHYFDNTAYVGDKINNRIQITWTIRSHTKPVYPVPVRFYEDANFEGDQREYYYRTVGPTPLAADPNGDFSKRITSLKVAPGWSVELCNASSAWNPKPLCERFYDSNWHVSHSAHDSATTFSLTPVAEHNIPPVRLFYSPLYGRDTWYPAGGIYVHTAALTNGVDKRMPPVARWGMSSAKIKAGWALRACLGEAGSNCQNYYTDSPSFLADKPSYRPAAPIPFKTYIVSDLAAGAPPLIGFRYKNHVGPQLAVYPGGQTPLPAAEISAINSLQVQPGYVAKLCTAWNSGCIELTGNRPDLSVYGFGDKSPLYVSVRKL